MPTQTVILPEINLAFSYWYGEIALDDMLESQSAYMSMPLYQVGRPHLFDLSDIVHANITMSDFASYIDLVNEQAPLPRKTQVSIVAPTDVLFGLARQYQSLIDARGRVEAHVFRTEQDALACLGRSEDTIDQMLAKCPSWHEANRQAAVHRQRRAT